MADVGESEVAAEDVATVLDGDAPTESEEAILTAATTVATEPRTDAAGSLRGEDNDSGLQPELKRSRVQEEA